LSMALSGVAMVVKLAGALGAFKIGVPNKTLDYRQFRRSCLDLPVSTRKAGSLGNKKAS
jgi:hypothetical protein